MNIIYYIIPILILIIAMEFANFMTYGKFVSKQITDVYMNLDETKIILNIYSSSILYISKDCYIARIRFSIFTKYYIEGLGTIPRWSKLHKRVNDYFAIACKTVNKIKNLN